MRREPTGYGFRGNEPRRSMHSIERLSQRIEEREGRKQTSDILDEQGRHLALIETDTETGEIISVKPKRFVNVEQEAEHHRERIYITDETGAILPERLTRREAREQNKRYLVVTILLFHGDRMLVQVRSNKKDLDRGLSSVSAHGVGKEIFDAEGKRITDTNAAAIVNAALELTEELRHDAEPFRVRVWPGTHQELLDWAKTHEDDDADTVWLVPERFVEEGGYPLLKWKIPRTRALFSGVIFSQDAPSVSIDPHELESADWRTLPEVFQDPKAAEDLPEAAYEIVMSMFRNSSYEQLLGQKGVSNLLDRWMGKPREEKP